MIELIDAGGGGGSSDITRNNRFSAMDLFGVAERLPDGILNLDMVNPENWYKTFPYEIAMIHTYKGNDKYKGGEEVSTNPDIEQYVYSLPIPPEGIQTAMIPASNATPTFGGMVEETNTNKIWNIQMAGTTGISPNRSDEKGFLDTRSPARVFRDTKKNLGLISGALDRFANMGATAQQALKDAKSGDQIEFLNKLFTTNPIFTESAVSKSSNGYYEIQMFHRFLFLYSKLKDVYPDNWMLVFRNYKDGLEWRVALQSFSINKSKTNPYMYRYNIAFKAWDLKPVNGEKFQQDRFAKGGDLHGLKTFTATGMLTKIANLTAKITSGPGAIIDVLSGGSPVI